MPEIYDQVAAAARAGIPTVVINAGLRASGQISFVSTNNYKGGTLAAIKMGALLGGKGNLVVFRWMAGNAASGEREKGFIDVIKARYPGIKIISDDVYAEGNYETAKRRAEEIVKRFGAEADGVFAPTQITSEAMLQAVRDSGLAKGNLTLVGFDSSDMLIDALQQGEIKGLVVQQPANMGGKAVEALVSHFQHKEVAAEIDTGCAVVTRDNVSDPAIQQILSLPRAKTAKD